MDKKESHTFKNPDLIPSLFPKCPSKINWTLNNYSTKKEFILTNAHPYQRGYFYACVKKNEDNPFWWDGTLEVVGKLLIKGMWRTKREAQKDIRDMAIKYVAKVTKELEK